MKYNKPNFTDSELYFMEGIIEEDKKRWINNFSNSIDFEEIKNEYNSILEKLKHWRQEENKWNKAINSLVTNN
jgi:hypothetical protein